MLPRTLLSAVKSLGGVLSSISEVTLGTAAGRSILCTVDMIKLPP
jgi:hypothetical protein